MRRLETLSIAAAAVAGVCDIFAGSLSGVGAKGAGIGSLCLTALVAGLVALHLFKKQRRVHMAPLYAAVAVRVVAGWFGAVVSGIVPWHVATNAAVWLVALGSTACVLSALALGMGMLFPLSRFPVAPGPHSVGTASMEVVDYTRPSSSYPRAGRTPREVLVRMWYPADPGAADVKNRLVYGTVRANFIRRLAELTNLPPAVLSHLRKLRTRSVVNAPVAATAADGSLPVVLFSHGMYGYTWQNTVLCEALASYGMLVVAPSHEGDSLLSRPFLAKVPKGVEADTTREAERDFWRPAFDNRAADLSFVLGAMASLAAGESGALGRPTATPTPLLRSIARSADLTHVAAVGHSFGGGTVTRFSTIDPRCVTVVALDGWLWPMNAQQLGFPESPTAGDSAESTDVGETAEPAAAAEQAEDGGGSAPRLPPILQLSATDWEWTAGQVPNRSRLVQHRPGSRHMSLLNSNHHNFNDTPMLFAHRLLRKTGAIGAADPMLLVEAITALTASWVNATLARAVDPGSVVVAVAGAPSNRLLGEQRTHPLAFDAALSKYKAVLRAAEGDVEYERTAKDV